MFFQTRGACYACVCGLTCRSLEEADLRMNGCVFFPVCFDHVGNL